MSNTQPNQGTIYHHQILNHKERKGGGNSPGNPMMRSLIRSSQSLSANMIYAKEQNKLCYDEGYEKLKIFYDTLKRAVFCWNAKKIKPEMNLKALDTSSRSCRCRGSSSWHWPRHLHLLLLLLVLLLFFPLYFSSKSPSSPPPPVLIRPI